MVSIVLASHGDLAAGIKQTGSMVFGDQPSVAVVSLEPSMGPDDFRAKVEEAVASFEDQEQVLFLVDLWGGTPFNQISGLIEGHDSWAIATGVNLPMLIEAYSQRFDAKNTAHAIAKHLVTEAKAGVRVKPESLEPEEKKPAAAAAAPAGAIPPGTVIGDGHIKIAHVRIDTRLLHGQVATTWTKQINPNRIIVVSDGVAHDELRKTMIEQAASGSPRQRRAHQEDGRGRQGHALWRHQGDAAVREPAGSAQGHRGRRRHQGSQHRFHGPLQGQGRRHQRCRYGR